MANLSRLASEHQVPPGFCLTTGAPAFNDEQAVEMAGLASGLEEQLGWPVDIEWVVLWDQAC